MLLVVQPAVRVPVPPASAADAALAVIWAVAALAVAVAAGSVPAAAEGLVPAVAFAARAAGLASAAAAVAPAAVVAVALVAVAVLAVLQPAALGSRKVARVVRTPLGRESDRAARMATGASRQKPVPRPLRREAEPIPVPTPCAGLVQWRSCHAGPLLHQRVRQALCQARVADRPILQRYNVSPPTIITLRYVPWEGAATLFP